VTYQRSHTHYSTNIYHFFPCALPFAHSVSITIARNGILTTITFDTQDTLQKYLSTMYISHLITAPFLLHRYFPSKVNPITLAMASVTPDILSNLYLVMMEVMRILIKQKVEIHDHTKPPGWIELDSGQPLGVGRWTHSLGGAMCLGKRGFFCGL